MSQVHSQLCLFNYSVNLWQPRLRSCACNQLDHFVHRLYPFVADEPSLNLILY